ncbi:histone-like nucleoid-structuring protein Lsr2 [Streptomyces sp. NPDC005538]|uniref:Lsr2 family DNA-binding protein n=1 Tax=Streptomyces sp. NPDC005538 TaxID=3157043 RepID=UPI0033B2AA5D
MESATVRILKARTRGLVEVWSRDYRSAWIQPSAINRLTTLLRKQQERLARNPERAEQDRAAAREANARRAERARLASRRGGRSSGERGKPRATSGGSQDAAQIRAWAKENGHEVNTRGPVSASIREAYEKANV